ncbi:MAG: sulfur carrier protein ThiS [Anaerolineae bacterium]|nr:sulfur carrier protein ThiS [Anaerolineae bacterium]
MITINKRQQVTWYAGMTVQALLDALKYSYPHIIVTINGDLVKHDAYEQTTVPDEADVRVIHLIAGG